jgi:hypothetical protein
MNGSGKRRLSMALCGRLGENEQGGAHHSTGSAAVSCPLHLPHGAIPAKGAANKLFQTIEYLQ